ncbi:MAG: glycosyltransferase family 2 protein [Haloferacaceae archaeon]
MDVSVVVPTLNARERLSACLDALAAHAPGVEVVVVNGPSADGTTGMVRDRDDVDVLVEISSRNPNVSRNAGIEAATGGVVAFVSSDLRVSESWLPAIEDGLADAPVVTGPTHRAMAKGTATETPERVRVRSRDVTFFNGRNVALRDWVLSDLDGFDEYLETAGERDAAHRLAGLGHEVRWRRDMSVREELGADGGAASTGWGWRYRARTYSLVKNYGLRPSVAFRIAARSVGDAAATARDLLRGSGSPSAWVGNGGAVLSGIYTGASDGLVARTRDRTATRNPHGVSARADRVVTKYDWR